MRKSEIKVLKNKPLVEAIFEMRWKPIEKTQGINTFPDYRILVGRLYDRVREEYPFHEQLPAASMPDEIAGYVIQHRFRKNQNEWPLIQIGPGIITINDTEGYVWEDFERRIVQLIDNIFKTFLDLKNLKINSLTLRYIDSIAFDYEKDNIFYFLKDKMKTNIEIYNALFKDTEVDELPLGFDLRFVYPSNNPKGAVKVRFTKGRRKGSDALIWETIVQSIEIDAPDTKDKIRDWVKKAHVLSHDWFFKLIDGELLRRFE